MDYSLVGQGFYALLAISANSSNNNVMNKEIPEIDISLYMQGLLLSEAMFKYGDPELIASYNTGAAINNAKKPQGFLDILSMATEGINALNQLKADRENIINRLKSEILDLIKNGDLIAYGFKEPRDIADKPIKIPDDLFFSATLNWENSELKNRNFEFSGIRLIQNKSPIIDLKAKNSDNKKIDNSKSGKINFSDLEDDRYIDEKLASEFLGIAVKTLQGYRVKGGGPEFRKIGAKTVRYKFSDLKQWAESRKKKNTSQY